MEKAAYNVIDKSINDVFSYKQKVLKSLASGPTMKPIKTVHIVGMGALGLLYGSIIQTHLGAE
jgi:hypothetical protein